MVKQTLIDLMHKLCPMTYCLFVGFKSGLSQVKDLQRSRLHLVVLSCVHKVIYCYITNCSQISDLKKQPLYLLKNSDGIQLSSSSLPWTISWGNSLGCIQLMNHLEATLNCRNGWDLNVQDGFTDISGHLIGMIGTIRGWMSISIFSMVAGSLYMVVQGSKKEEADPLLRSSIGSYTASLSPYCLLEPVTGPAQNQVAEKDTSLLDGWMVRSPYKKQTNKTTTTTKKHVE